MSNINEVRERLADRADGFDAFCDNGMASDIRALLADHARLQKAHCDALNWMRRAVVALAYAQQNDPIYLQAYGFLDEAIKQAKTVKK